MNLRKAVEDLLSASYEGVLEIAYGEAHTPLSELVSKLNDLTCSAEVLQAELRPIKVVEAHAIVWAVLHKSMAYGYEGMPAEQAMQLAWRFIDAFGKKASFFSTTVPPSDPRDSIGAWYFIGSSSTFEALLCCRGEQHSALLLATDED
jgi:hypothetical protein